MCIFVQVLTRLETPGYLELDFQAVAGHKTWVLGMELESSAGAPNL